MSVVTVFRKKVTKRISVDKMIVLKITVLAGQNQKGLLIPVISLRNYNTQLTSLINNIFKIQTTACMNTKITCPIDISCPNSTLETMQLKDG